MTLLGSLTDETACPLVAAAAGLRPSIAAAATEIERQRRVPAGIIKAIADAGIFRMLLPREFGGDEVELAVAVAVTTEIARADASAGWQVLVGAGNQYFLGKLGETSMRAAMTAGDDVLVRGALAPKGQARPVPGGYRLTGRWPLASGSYAPAWIPAGFLILDENGPRRLPDGRLDLRLAVLAPDQVTWFDTWDSVGLRGSQSQDFAVDDVFVAQEWTGSFFADSSIDAPWFRLPPMPTAPLHAAVVVGALKGMVDDLGALAATKQPAFGPGTTLAEDPVFTSRFGERAADVDMLDVANHHVALRFMQLARAGGGPDPQEYQRLHAINARIHHAATEIANDLLGLAGSTALYLSSDLQRRWRDIRAAAAHVSASPGNYTALGASLSGAPARRAGGHQLWVMTTHPQPGEPEVIQPDDLGRTS